MKIAYFDCFSGISGDMTIAAFLDAGLPVRRLAEGLKRLGIKGYRIESSRVRRGAISGTHFRCIAGGAHVHRHRSLREIRSIIDRSGLAEGVRSTAKGIFENIARAEAKVHGARDGRSVYLHELGETDSIVDIVGTAIAVDALGIEEVRSSPVTMGRTLAATAHGTIPIPGPAALELLKGVPVEISDERSELVTPTGAGILKTLASGFGAMPLLEVSAVGYGAGSTERGSVPNMLRVVIGSAHEGVAGGTVKVVEANIDDMNPQYFDYVQERLFAEGALDVYVTPIQMKKSRPAFKLTAICEPSRLRKIALAMMSETTTIGVRFYDAGRMTLERRVKTVSTQYGAVGVKMSSGPDGIRTVSPEYEDCRRAASRKRVPLRAVYEAARAAAG